MHPDLVQLHKKLSKKGVVLIGLSNEPDAKVAPHIRKDKTPYIIGSGSASIKDWGVRAYPTAFVIDTKGKVTFKGHPANPAFKKAIDAAMKKTPPTPGRPFAEAEAADSFHKAGRLMKQKHYALAIQLYEDIVHNYADTPFAKQAGKRLAKIHKDADVMTRVRDAAAEKKCTAWLEMARGLVKAGRRDAARKYYKRIIKGYGDTTYARTARQEIADL